MLRLRSVGSRRSKFRTRCVLMSLNAALQGDGLLVGEQFEIVLLIELVQQLAKQVAAGEVLFEARDFLGGSAEGGLP